MPTNEKQALYRCGLPHCQALVELPRRSQTAAYPHRDRNLFRCNGVLVLLELTPGGKRDEMERMFRAQVAEQLKLMRRPG